VAASCHGNGDEHCCWLHGVVCVHLEENTVPGRRWACGLRRELGSWDAVHTDPRYAPVQAILDEWGYTCGSWGPGTNQCCFADAETPVAVK